MRPVFPLREGRKRSNSRHRHEKSTSLTFITSSHQGRRDVMFSTESVCRDCMMEMHTCKIV